jgi:hypothetical protein
MGVLGQARATIDKNYQRADNSGYVVDNVPCRGITKLLQRTFYSNFKPIKIVRRKSASSVKDGDAFHRLVYHTYKCTSECTCKARFGVKTPRVRKDSPLAKRMELLNEFLRKQQWYVYDCEMIVGCPEHHIATSIDMVCVDNLDRPNNVILVELKTGYVVQKNIPRTLDKTGKMTGMAGKYIPNTYVNHHQLQLWFCCEAFQRSHGIYPTGAAVVYVNHGRRVHVEHAAPWWFRSKAMRDKMLAQLVGQR